MSVWNGMRKAKRLQSRKIAKNTEEATEKKEIEVLGRPYRASGCSFREMRGKCAQFMSANIDKIHLKALLMIKRSWTRKRWERKIIGKENRTNVIYFIRILLSVLDALNYLRQALAHLKQERNFTVSSAKSDAARITIFRWVLFLSSISIGARCTHWKNIKISSRNYVVTFLQYGQIKCERARNSPTTNEKKTTFQINYLRISGEHEVVQNRRNIRINLTWLKWARVPMLSPYRSISLNQTGILFENTLSITVDRKCERLHTRSSTHTSVHAWCIRIYLFSL